MNRIMRRTVAAVSAGVLTAVMLAGCGGSQATVKDGAYEAKQPIPASQAFKQKSIWYVISDTDVEMGAPLSKDTRIGTLLVFDGNGKVTTYDYGCAIKDLQGKTDEQILDAAEKHMQSQFPDQKNKALQDLESEYEASTTVDGKSLNMIEDELASLSDFTNEWQRNELVEQEKEVKDKIATNSPIYDKLKAALEKKNYKKPSPQPYNLYVGTDYERLAYSYEVFTGIGSEAFTDMSSGSSSSYDPNTVDGYGTKTNSLTFSPIGKFQSGDTWYSGYNKLVTRVAQDNAGFTLDDPSTEGVTVE